MSCNHRFFNSVLFGKADSKPTWQKSSVSKTDPNQPKCSSWLSCSDDDETTQETNQSSSRSSPTDTGILNHHHEHLATSTPCPPKSQPPQRDASGVYEAPERTSKPSEYEICEEQSDDPNLVSETGVTVIFQSDSSQKETPPTVNEATATVVDKKNDANPDDYDYQIPSNLDLNASTCL